MVTAGRSFQLDPAQCGGCLGGGGYAPTHPESQQRGDVCEFCSGSGRLCCACGDPIPRTHDDAYCRGCRRIIDEDEKIARQAEAELAHAAEFPPAPKQIKRALDCIQRGDLRGLVRALRPEYAT